MITTHLILEWKEHPVTHKLFKLIKETKEHQVNALSEGATLGTNAEQRTAYSAGFIKALNLILTADLKEEENEDGK